MKRYTICWPDEHGVDREETLTEEQILAEYYPYWCEQMRKCGMDPQEYTEQDCIDDWVVVNWAVEVK